MFWDRYAVTGKTAKFLIEFAYMRSDNRYGVTLRDDLVVEGPGWVNSRTFDVDAKVEDSQVEQLKQHPDHLADQMRMRVQSLLADRFKLRVRRETREVPVYALVVAKCGPKLLHTDPELSDRFAPGVFPFQPPKNPGCPAGMVCMKSRMSMAEMAFLLSRAPETERPVIDQTGLEGEYVIDLQYRHRHRPTAMVSAAARGGGNIANPTPPAPPSGPSLFEAVQKQLGLKVKSTKGPVEFIVIEHVEMPTDN